MIPKGGYLAQRFGDSQEKLCSLSSPPVSLGLTWGGGGASGVDFPEGRCWGDSNENQGTLDLSGEQGRAGQVARKHPVAGLGADSRVQ